MENPLKKSLYYKKDKTKNKNQKLHIIWLADVVELVDTSDLGSDGF